MAEVVPPNLTAGSTPLNTIASLRDAVDQLDNHTTTASTTTPTSTISLPTNKHVNNNHVNKSNMDSDFYDFKHAESLEVKPNDAAIATLQSQTVIHETANLSATDTLSPTSTKQRFVSPKDFELLKVIGMGAFGKVLQVRNRHSKQILAMKVISKRLLRRKSGYIENVQAERNILTRIRHPFVVTMHCSFQSKEKLFIIMDFLAGGELFLRIGREGIFLEKTAAFYLAEIILALDHLHSLGILHRDLKPENILLGTDGHVCLTDFGLAKDFSDNGGFQNDDDENRASTICGTQEYMAPEMVARKGYGRAADYWSLGCIAYEMLSGLPPFSSRQGAKELFRKIMSERVKMPAGSTAAACKLLKGLLNRDVQKRWGTAKTTMFEVGGVAGLKQAEFFKDIQWDKLEKKEIDPPAVFAVDGEEDLKHFHDEFTTMNLPRSVLEMSGDNYRPHRINSETFRGFSFIQDDFCLPDREIEELRSYFAHVQEDGESVSECASSKMGDPDAVPVETPTEKKKRPPRKRKKKNKNVNADSAATTPNQSAATTPVPSAATTPAPSRSTSPVPDAKSSDLSTVNLQESKTETPGEEPLVPQVPVVSVTQPKTVTAPPVVAPSVDKAKPPKPAVDSWQNVSTAKKKATAPSKQNKQSQPQQQPNFPGRWATQSNQRAHVQSQGLQSRVGGQPWQQSQHKAIPPPQPQQGQQPSRWPAAANASDWRQHSRASATASGRPAASSQQPGWATSAPPPPPPELEARPSSDWRQHSMSPRLSPRSVKSISTSQSTPAWPSLGGQTSQSVSAVATRVQPKNQTTAKLQGAWASRTKR